MTVYLADSSVILDIVTDDQEWAGWSRDRLDDAAATGRVVINPIVYAESSASFTAIEAWEAALAELAIAMVELPKAALFLAARTFRVYRRRGGARPAILPDFFIGAHAAISGLTLITRDRRRLGYFPTVMTISP